MAKIYDKNGFPDFEKIHDLSGTLNVLLAARSTGKTYGLLKKVLSDKNRKMLFMRTTKKDLEESLYNDNSTINQLNQDEGWHYYAQRNSKSAFYSIYADYTINDRGKKAPVGEEVHKALSLIDTGGVRGIVDMSLTDIVYDEFIKRKQEIIRNYKYQAEAYLDIVFSVNRDRELRGLPPLKQWLLGNSDNLNVPLLTYFNLVGQIISMRDRHENYRKLPEKNISIFLMDDCPRAEMLKQTELGRLTDGTEYADMAYSNDFINDDFENCIAMPIGQYNPLFTIAGIMVMQHKTKERWYVREYTGEAINGCRRFPGNDRGRVQCRESWAFLYFMYMEGLIYFSRYTVKLKFREIFNIDDM